MSAGSASEYVDIFLEAIGRPTHSLSLLDLCCNEMTITRTLGFKRSLHVDVQNLATRPTDFTFLKADVFDALRMIPDSSFDVCLCSDGIEHFLKPDGWRLIDEMERVSRFQFIFTPLGAMGLKPDSTHPDDHKSLWAPGDLTDKGWTVRVFPKWHEVWSIGAFFAWKGSVQ